MQISKYKLAGNIQGSMDGTLHVVQGNGKSSARRDVNQGYMSGGCWRAFGEWEEEEMLCYSEGAAQRAWPDGTHSFKYIQEGPGAVAYACNLSILGGQGRRIG